MSEQNSMESDSLIDKSISFKPPLPTNINNSLPKERSNSNVGVPTPTNTNNNNQIPKSKSALNLETAEEDEKEEKGSILLIAFFLMLFFQLGNRIFGRLQTFPMHNYPLFTNMLSTVVYIPICFAYIIPAVWAKSNVISKEELAIPKYKFGVMGFYDSLAGIMQTFAVNYISNSSTIVLVQQSAIPISMVISKFALKAQYTKAQYWGAFIVLFGIFLVLLPTFLVSKTSAAIIPETSNGSSDILSSSAAAAALIVPNPYELVWIFVLMISCVPMCLSSVYKEQALGETEINIVYLNGWVAVFQTLFAIPLCLPSATVISLPLDQIIPNMIGGCYCFVGINTASNDNCTMAPLYVSLFLAFNIVFNFLIVIILKHGSANILWMASTVIVPLSNVAFSLKFMPGSQPLKSMDIVGLFVIMSGLIVYRFMTPIFELIDQLRGVIPDVEENEVHAIARKISRVVAKKYSKYVGLNQIESLNTFIDTTIIKENEKKNMFRSTNQIRGNLLLKLGIPPSPAIMSGGGSGMNGGGGGYQSLSTTMNNPSKRASPFSTPVLPRRTPTIAGSGTVDGKYILPRNPSEIGSRGGGGSASNTNSNTNNGNFQAMKKTNSLIGSSSSSSSTTNKTPQFSSTQATQPQSQSQQPKSIQLSSLQKPNNNGNNQV